MSTLHARRQAFRAALASAASVGALFWGKGANAQVVLPANNATGIASITGGTISGTTISGGNVSAANVTPTGSATAETLANLAGNLAPFFVPTAQASITDGGFFGDGLAHPASSNGFATLAALQSKFRAASFTATGSGTNFAVSNVSPGALYPGLTLGVTTGIGAAITLVSQTSGTTGGAGVYVTSGSTTISGAAATASWASATSNDMAGLMIQAAIHAAHVNGTGRVPLGAGQYRNLPSGLILPPSTNALLSGDGWATQILCANCGTNPGLNIYAQANTRGPAENVTLFGLNAFTAPTTSSNGIAQTNIYTSGSRGVWFQNNNNLIYTGLSMVNFDLPMDWDTVVGNNYTITFLGSLLSCNNKGAVIAAAAPNSFERISFIACNIGNNNYGVYIVFQTSPTQGSGTGFAADAYFTNCSIDYNIVNQVYYIGGAFTGDLQNSVYLNCCHLETSTTVSGSSTTRMAHDGNLELTSCEWFENGSNTLGGIGHLSFYARTFAAGGKGPGFNTAGAAAAAMPLINADQNINVSRGVIGNRIPTSALYLRSSNGDVSGFVRADPTWAAWSSSGTLQLEHQFVPVMIVAASVSITVPSDANCNFIIGTEMRFVTKPTFTGTFVADSGVTINSSGIGLTFGGTLAKNVSLTKTGHNTWLASDQMT